MRFLLQAVSDATVVIQELDVATLSHVTMLMLMHSFLLQAWLYHMFTAIAYVRGKFSVPGHGTPILWFNGSHGTELKTTFPVVVFWWCGAGDRATAIVCRSMCFLYLLLQFFLTLCHFNQCIDNWRVMDARKWHNRQLWFDVSLWRGVVATTRHRTHDRHCSREFESSQGAMAYLLHPYAVVNKQRSSRLWRNCGLPFNRLDKSSLPAQPF